MWRLMSLLIWLSLLTSCLKTEVINAIEPEEHEAVVEKRRKPEKPMPENPEHNDTTRVPMSFDASVQDWDEKESDL